MICGIQVYCLIEIKNLLMGASLLALAKSIYYSLIPKQGSWVSLKLTNKQPIGM